MFNIKQILVLIAIFFTGVGLVIFNQQKFQVKTYIASSAPANLPGPSAPIPQPDTSAESPDGAATVTMKKQVAGKQTTYTFYTSTSSDGSQKQIFSKTEDQGNSISIPFNTWSPKNKYLFLKEDTQGKTNYYVFSANGDSFANNSQYLNPVDAFAQKYPDLKLTDVTGWADTTLLILNANKADGSEGPSFWYDLSNQSFIQLSRRFN